MCEGEVAVVIFDAERSVEIMGYAEACIPDGNSQICWPGLVRSANHNDRELTLNADGHEICPICLRRKTE